MLQACPITNDAPISCTFCPSIKFEASLCFVLYLRACTFHPGPPIFHERQKGWSCCNKICYDFDEFMVGLTLPFDGTNVAMCPMLRV